MSDKKVVSTDKGPPALKGIFSQAIIANDTVYCSGAIGVDPVTGKIIDTDIQARTVCVTAHKPFSSRIF